MGAVVTGEVEAGSQPRACSTISDNWICAITSITVFVKYKLGGGENTGTDHKRSTPKHAPKVPEQRCEIQQIYKLRSYILLFLSELSTDTAARSFRHPLRGCFVNYLIYNFAYLCGSFVIFRVMPRTAYGSDRR